MSVAVRKEAALLLAAALALFQGKGHGHMKKLSIGIFTYRKKNKKVTKTRDLGFCQVAAPEFLQIGVGTALNVLGGVVVDWAIQHDSDLFTGKHVGPLGSNVVSLILTSTHESLRTRSFFMGNQALPWIFGNATEMSCF